jgi:hypothetical protein
MMARSAVSLTHDGKRPKCKMRGNMGNHRVFEATPPELPAECQPKQRIEPDSAQNHNRSQWDERCHRWQMTRSEQDRRNVQGAKLERRRERGPYFCAGPDKERHQSVSKHKLFGDPTVADRHDRRAYVRKARDREQPDRGRKHSVEHDDNRACAESDKRCEGQSRHLHQRRRVAKQTRGYPGPKLNTFTKVHACSDPRDQKRKWLHHNQSTQNVVRYIRENTKGTQRVDVCPRVRATRPRLPRHNQTKNGTKKRADLARISGPFHFVKRSPLPRPGRFNPEAGKQHIDDRSLRFCSPCGSRGPDPSQHRNLHSEASRQIPVEDWHEIAPAAQPDRARVRPPQGLATHRHQLRQTHTHFHKRMCFAGTVIF